MMWFWLSLSKFFNKIGNYFYHKHVASVKTKTRESVNEHRKTATGNRGRRRKRT